MALAPEVSESCSFQLFFDAGGRVALAPSLVLAALMFGAACSEDAVKKIALGDPCNPARPSECADGLCIPLDDQSGFCSRHCADAAGCPETFRCEDSGAFGLVCRASNDCTGDQDCPSGHRCEVATGRCYIKVSRQLCSPCTTDLQCPEGGACFEVPATGERYCTAPCGADGACAAGYACKDVPVFRDGATQVKKQCVPDNAAGTCQGGRGLCAPCKGDEECGGFFDLCVRNVVSGETFCGTACDPASQNACPTGFTCTDLSGDGKGPHQCVPISNSCTGYCDSVEERAQVLQCGLGHECDLANRACEAATDGRQCAPCRETDDCRRPGHESNECVMNGSSSETFCAEPCPPVDGDKDCQQRFGPGFVCAKLGAQGQYCVPQRGTCASGLGRLGDSCSANGAADCVTGTCLSYGKTALCSAGCALDSDCGDSRAWRCCALSGDFYDCSDAQRNAAKNGPAAGAGVCAPNGGLFGDDCSPGRPPCQSGTCLDIGTARLCTVPCAADGACPAEFVCRQAFADSGAAVNICFPDGGGAPGGECEFGPAACADRLCIKKASGPICTRPCADGQGCPADWACEQNVPTVTGQFIEACIPPELQ